MRLSALLAAALLAFAPESALARGQSSHRRPTAHETTRSRVHHTKRDPAQRREFMRENPCPGGPDRGSTKRCHGYVVDHVKALKRGGADRPGNMQWMTKAEAKAKDRWE